MPQMSPCSWLNLLLTSNFLLYTLKLSLFFEKKC
nr:ATP synthase F0 subunit 8 [Unkanodes sapporona]